MNKTKIKDVKKQPKPSIVDTKSPLPIPQQPPPTEVNTKKPLRPDKQPKPNS